MRIRRGDIQVFSISFLDVLSCALGAVIILLVIAPMSPPTPEAKITVIQNLQTMIQSLKAKSSKLERQVKTLKTENQKIKKDNKSVKKIKNQTTPSVFGLPLKAEDAVFVIDVSKSMDWQVDNLYNTLESLLRSCDVKRFRFIYYDQFIYDSERYWPYGWFPGTKKNKDLALNNSKQLLSSLINSEPYSTNSGDALYTALGYRDTDVIYFITDGFPTWGETNVEYILRKVRRLNSKNAIINSVMVGLPGATSNRYGKVVFLPEARPKELYDFLHKLAEQNGGAYVGR